MYSDIRPRVMADDIEIVLALDCIIQVHVGAQQSEAVDRRYVTASLLDKRVNCCSSRPITLRKIVAD